MVRCTSGRRFSHVPAALTEGAAGQTKTSHPAVLECAVFGIPDAQWGEAVHAVIRLRDGEQTDAETLRAHCATRIARYKCPRSIALDTTPLPRSAIGKVLKTELRRSYWAGQTRNVH